MAGCAGDGSQDELDVIPAWTKGVLAQAWRHRSIERAVGRVTEG